MGSSGSNEEAKKQFEAALCAAAKKLLKPPSSIDELLIILEEVDKLLYFVPQSPSDSMIRAFFPAMKGLIADELLKHPDLDIQVAVASIASEMIRITAPEYPYRGEHMRVFFKLIMVAFKQLANESGRNYEKAQRILKTVASVRACLMMLDLEIDPMIVEMFQLFLDTIRPNHSSNMFNHMKTIMTLIIQESDEISVELLRPLLFGVRLENKKTSPRSWELGITVFENCAAKLKGYVGEAVKALNLNVDCYAEIIASLCQDTPIGRDTVAKEEVASVWVVHEEATTTSGDGVPKLDTVPETRTQGERRRRELKPNTFTRADEGYQHIWLAGGRGSSRAYYYLLSPSELEMASNGKRGVSKQSQVKKGSNKQKRTTKSITPQIPESADVGEKVLESLSSVRAKAEYPSDLDIEKEKEPVDFPPEHGSELVNLRIQVWWPLDEEYYTGTVESFEPVTKKHKIKYDDDDEDILDMSEERWKLVGERQSQQAQSSGKQEADPSEEPGKSNGEGCSIVKYGHSADESIPVSDDECNDESCGTIIPWRARAMSRAARKRLSSLKRERNPSA